MLDIEKVRRSICNIWYASTKCTLKDCQQCPLYDKDFENKITSNWYNLCDGAFNLRASLCMDGNPVDLKHPLKDKE